jgi:hypothetical protein
LNCPEGQVAKERLDITSREFPLYPGQAEQIREIT